MPVGATLNRSRCAPLVDGRHLHIDLGRLDVANGGDADVAADDRVAVKGRARRGEDLDCRADQRAAVEIGVLRARTELQDHLADGDRLRGRLARGERCAAADHAIGHDADKREADHGGQDLAHLSCSLPRLSVRSPRLPTAQRAQRGGGGGHGDLASGGEPSRGTSGTGWRSARRRSDWSVHRSFESTTDDGGRVLPGSRTGFVEEHRHMPWAQVSACTVQDADDVAGNFEADWADPEACHPGRRVPDPCQETRKEVPARHRAEWPNVPAVTLANGALRHRSTMRRHPRRERGPLTPLPVTWCCPQRYGEWPRRPRGRRPQRAVRTMSYERIPHRRHDCCARAAGNGRPTASRRVAARRDSP